MRMKRLICLLTVIAVMAAMTGFAGPAFAGSKTKKMTAYDNVLKSGNIVYCCSTKGLSRVNLKTGEVRLLKVSDWYGYQGYGAMKKKGNYLYFFSEGSSYMSTILYRMNLKSFKKQKLIRANTKTFSGIQDYVLSGKKIYVTGWYMNDDDSERTVKRVMKANGKSKKKTSVRAHLIRKATNKKGYRIVEYGNLEEGQDVACYLRTPSGRSYYLGTAYSDYDKDDYYEEDDY